MPQRSAKCKHGFVICSKCVVITDAGKRMSDRINLMTITHPWDALKNGWMAFRLADGDSDGTLYDSRADAVSHQLHEKLCAYFFMRNALGGVNARDCQLYLNLHRHVYDNGGDMAEPAAPSLILSTRSHDIMSGRVNPRAN